LKYLKPNINIGLGLDDQSEIVMKMSLIDIINEKLISLESAI
jgi:hypothetical protein